MVSDAFLDVLHAVDISRGGVCICANHRFAGCNIDEPVELILKLPNSSSSFSAKGIIRHQSGSPRGDVFGVQFTEISSRGQALIAEYVARMLERGRGT